MCSCMLQSGKCSAKSSGPGQHYRYSPLLHFDSFTIYKREAGAPPPTCLISGFLSLTHPQTTYLVKKLTSCL